MRMSVRKTRRSCYAHAVLALCAAQIAAGTPPGDASASALRRESAQVTGIITPSRTTTLACFQQAEIVRYLVREGEWVVAGQPLLEMDEGVAAARAETSRAEAESNLQVELRRAQMEHAAAELQRIETLAEQNSASLQEVNDARSAARVTKLQFEIAQFERMQARRTYERDALLLEQLRIQAPFDGYVSQRLKQDGEIVEQREGLLVLVQLDPLEVVVDCPLELADRIQLGDAIRFVPSMRSGLRVLVPCALPAASPTPPARPIA